MTTKVLEERENQRKSLNLKIYLGKIKNNKAGIYLYDLEDDPLERNNLIHDSRYEKVRGFMRPIVKDYILNIDVNIIGQK